MKVRDLIKLVERDGCTFGRQEVTGTIGIRKSPGQSQFRAILLTM